MNGKLSVSFSPRHYPIVVAALASVAAVSSYPSVQQGQVSEAAPWEVPRTSHGHPDLQGNWTNATLTPFQRLAGQGPVLTWEEVAEIEARQIEMVARGAAPSDPNRPPLPQAC